MAKPKLLYYVVGDKGLNSGNGVYVATLEQMKAKLLKTGIKTPWRLVVSMHGAEDLLATVGGAIRNRSHEGAYETARIKRIFTDDKTWTQWRDKYGPTRVVFNSCQLNKPFENVLLTAFTKKGSKQRAQGLGTGCRPNTIPQKMYYPLGKSSRSRKGSGATEVRITKRSQWNKIPKRDRPSLFASLKELNKKYGYFGSPPVKESEILNYFFDVAPKGAWPQVTVSKNRTDTGISFWNRTSSANFLGKHCRAHLGKMRGHKSKAPPAASRPSAPR